MKKSDKDVSQTGVEAAAWAVVNNWYEFGPTGGLDEYVHRLDSALRKAAPAPTADELEWENRRLRGAVGKYEAAFKVMRAQVELRPEWFQDAWDRQMKVLLDGAREIAATTRPETCVHGYPKAQLFRCGFCYPPKDSSVIDKKQTEPVIHREQAQQDCGCRIANGGNAALTCPHGNKIGGAQSVRERKESGEES